MLAQSHDDSWGVAYLIKQYFNARVREGQKVSSAERFYSDFVAYWETKYRKEIDKKASPKAKAKWVQRRRIKKFFQNKFLDHHWYYLCDRRKFELRDHKVLYYGPTTGLFL